MSLTDPRPLALAVFLLAVFLRATAPAPAATDTAPGASPPGARSSATVDLPPAPDAAPPPPGEPTPEARRVEACKAHALARLKPGSPSIADIFIDMDGLTIAAADMKVGGAHISAVIMGEAYIQRDRADKVHRFLCLRGAGDTVLLTFFTEQ